MRRGNHILRLMLIIGTIGSSAADGEIPDRLRLFALDVGEGQAILLQRGERGVLLDTGHAGMSRHVLERLEANGTTQLDYLVLTHLHPDHASGYFRLREAFPTTAILDHHQTISRKKMPDMVRWVTEALARDKYRLPFQAGDRIVWQGVTLAALWPNGPAGENINDNSLVIEVSHGKHRALLMGDVSSKIEEQLLSAGSLHGPYDILVAGHHGSQGTSSREFLSQVQPAYTIVSTNADNIRGYPAPATLKRLQAHTAKALLTTYRHGEICLEWQAGTDLPQRCSPAAPEKR